MTDIIDRLNDPDTCMDAIDDAIAEIKLLRSELSDAQLANDEAASAARWNGDALRDAARWIPTSERIPPICETVLIPINGAVAWAYWDMEQEGDWETGYKKYRMWYFIEQDNDEYEPYLGGEPEYWMPLPPAPDVTKSVTE